MLPSLRRSWEPCRGTIPAQAWLYRRRFASDLSAPVRAPIITGAPSRDLATARRPAFSEVHMRLSLSRSRSVARPSDRIPSRRVLPFRRPACRISGLPAALHDLARQGARPQQHSVPTNLTPARRPPWRPRPRPTRTRRWQPPSSRAWSPRSAPRPIPRPRRALQASAAGAAIVASGVGSNRRPVSLAACHPARGNTVN